MMVKKIISGGQSGTGRAALDIAIELRIHHGGWIPKGRKTDTGPLPARYRLKEILAGSYFKSIELNVIDSDGTLVISHGEPTAESGLAKKLSKKHRRPCLHIDLDDISDFKAVEIISSIYHK